MESTNSSRSTIRLFWDPPTRPNGAVVSYTILYVPQAQDAVEEKRCITESDYIKNYKKKGYPLNNLNSGNYTIRISTNTLAGEGQYSDSVYVFIKVIIIKFVLL